MFMKSGQNNIPLVIFLLALGARVGLVWYFHFDGLYGQDSFAYYHYAESFWQDHSFLVHWPWLSEPMKPVWPVGYPILIAFTFTFLGVNPLGGLVISILLGSLTSVSIYLLAGEMFAAFEYSPSQIKGMGTVSALAVALSGLHLQSSIVIMSDASGLFFATLSVLLWLRYLRSPGSYRAMLLGGVLAFSIMVRYIYILMIVPLFLHALISLPSTNFRKRHLLWAGGIFLIVLSPQIVYAIDNPAPFSGVVSNWNLENAIKRSFTTTEGTANYKLPVALFYLMAMFSPDFLSPLFVPVFLWGGREVMRKNMYGPAALLLGWLLTIYIFLIGIPYQNFRFILATLTPLTLICGLGIVSGVRYFRFAASGSFYRTGLVTISAVGFLVLIFISTLFFSFQRIEKFISQKEADLKVVNWLKNNLSHDSSILTFGLTPMLHHYSNFRLYDIYFPKKTEIQKFLSNFPPCYLVVDRENLQKQWQGTNLFDNYRWIAENYEIQEIIQIGKYSISWIRGG